MTVLLNPKSSGIRHFFCMILVVYLGHGIFHPVCSTRSFIFLQVRFLGEVLSSSIEEPEEKKWLVHLYRSRRRKKKKKAFELTSPVMAAKKRQKRKRLLYRTAVPWRHATVPYYNRVSILVSEAHRLRRSVLLIAYLTLQKMT